MKTRRVAAMVLSAALFSSLSASGTHGDPPLQRSIPSPGAHLGASPPLGDAPAVVSSGKASLVRALDPSRPIRITLALQGPRDDELERAALAIADKSSPGYRHFLSFDELKQRYEPSDADAASVERWARSIGLREVRRSKTNRALVFDTSVGRVNELFGVHMGQYTEGERSFFANDRAPQLPAGAPEKIWAVLGLESYTRPAGTHAPDSPEPRVSAGPSVVEVPPLRVDKPASVHSTEEPTPAISPGGNDAPKAGTYEPADIAGPAAYNLLPLLGLSDCCNPTGDRNGPPKETSLAIINLNAADPEDYKHFFAHYNNDEGSHIHVIQIDGPTSGDYEATLDIEWSGALLGINGAAGTEIYDYAGGPDSTFAELLATLDHALGDDRARVLNISYGYSEPFLSTPSGPSRELTLFHQTLAAMVLGGWTVVASSGDDGAYDDCQDPGLISVGYPGSDPFVVSVGGTALDLKGPPTTFTVETAWNGSGCMRTNGNGGGGGGGCSTIFAALPWQQGINGSCDNGMRSIPDVAFNAAPYGQQGDPGQAYYVHGSWAITGSGTSQAAPELAAFFVYENSYLRKFGIDSIGLNALPALYNAPARAPHNPYYDGTRLSNGGGYGPGWAAGQGTIWPLAGVQPICSSWPGR